MCSLDPPNCVTWLNGEILKLYTKGMFLVPVLRPSQLTLRDNSARYASLYFVACVTKDDNELMTLEVVHHFVEVLDRYFGNVCELDLIFNFHKAYFILDECLIGGELQESSKRTILRVCAAQDALMEEETQKNT